MTAPYPYPSIPSLTLVGPVRLVASSSMAMVPLPPHGSTSSVRALDGAQHARRVRRSHTGRPAEATSTDLRGAPCVPWGENDVRADRIQQAAGRAVRHRLLLPLGGHRRHP